MNFLLPLILLLAITTSYAMETNSTSFSLPGSAWQVATFAGQSPLTEHPITFEFDTEGNIAGDASCNRFGGSCQIEGDKIQVGRLRSTRRACEPDVMEQEYKFLALLGAAATWSLDGDKLVLTTPDGEIRAERQSGPAD